MAPTPVTLKLRLASVLAQVQTHKPYTVTFDLTDPGAIVGAAAEILQCFGYVDVLINNAGISYRGTIVDTSLDVDRRVMETNYFGPVALTKGNRLGWKGRRAQARLHSLYFPWFLLPRPGLSHPFDPGVSAVLTAWVLAFLGFYFHFRQLLYSLTSRCSPQQQPHLHSVGSMSFHCVWTPTEWGLLTSSHGSPGRGPPSPPGRRGLRVPADSPPPGSQHELQ